MSVQSLPTFFDTAGLEEMYLQSPHLGSQLRLGHWRPEEPSRGSVVILPGRGDFLEKYAQLAAFLSARGYGVYNLDWPGQGSSGRLGHHPQAGHIGSYNDYGAAFGTFLEAYGLVDEPVFWIAYSMGGTVALKELLKETSHVQGVVLLSPMFGFAEVLPEGVIRTLADSAHWLGLGRHFALGEGPTDVSTWDIAKSQAVSGGEAFGAFRAFLREHPHYLLGGSSWGWVRASLAAFRELRQADLTSIHTPVLIVSAEAEQTVSLHAQKVIANRLPNATLVSLPGKHDLLLNTCDGVARLFALVADFVEGSARSRPQVTQAHTD